MSKVSLYSVGCFLSTQTWCRVWTAAYDVCMHQEDDLRAIRTGMKTARLRGVLNGLSGSIPTYRWLQACF